MPPAMPTPGAHRAEAVEAVEAWERSGRAVRFAAQRGEVTKGDWYA